MRDRRLGEVCRFVALIVPLGLPAGASAGAPSSGTSPPSGSNVAPPGEDSPPDVTPSSSPRAGPAPREPVTLGDALPDEASAHLAFTLTLQDEAGVEALLAEQQDPTSPRYHAWLTPEQFGERFGLSEESYARIIAWIGAEGFAVTRYPNRLFVEASGTTAGVRRLLRVQPRSAKQGKRVFRSVVEKPSVPADIAPLIARISGLDTRIHLRRKLAITVGVQATEALGAADLRALYDVPPASAGAAGLTLVILGTQEGTQPTPYDVPAPPLVPPSVDAIEAYMTTISGATAAYNPLFLPNGNEDFDVAGANIEYQLDVEMETVGAPNAKEIDLVLAPASEVLTTGAEFIANGISTAIAVSTSLGGCEPAMFADPGVNPLGSEAYALRAAVQQGLAEGQTWFAAAGDMGADVCDDASGAIFTGFGGGSATVAFPCSLPELLCLGGTQLQAPGSWSSSGVLTGWQAEAVWNEGLGGGAGGGGQSFLYAKPAWQAGAGPNANDGARDVPDIALASATETPGIAIYGCGSGQDPISCAGGTTGAGPIEVVGGTSAAAPLAAGLFAELAGQVGCRLGDAHPVIYALGAAARAGGAQPFHDITVGNNSFEASWNQLISGFTAGPGYDLASGWGSLDMAQLESLWPSCVVARPDAGAPPLGETTAAVIGIGSRGGCAAAPAAPGRGGLGVAIAAGLGALSLRRRRRMAESRAWRIAASGHP
jgi:subtilase family serine protease